MKKLITLLSILLLLSGCGSEKVKQAQTLLAQEQFEQAIQLLETELKEKPKNAKANFMLGNAYACVFLNPKNETSEDAIFEKAVRAYESAVARKPNFVAAHYNLGVLLSHRKQTEKAISELRKVTSLNPEHIGAHAYLSEIESDYELEEGKEIPTETMLAATGNGVIRGMVVDTTPDRNPIPYAEISYVGTGVDNRGIVSSDETGNYEIKGSVRSGQYLLNAEKSGYIKREGIPVTSVAGKDTVVEIKMRKVETEFHQLLKLHPLKEGWVQFKCVSDWQNAVKESKGVCMVVDDDRYRLVEAGTIIFDGNRAYETKRGLEPKDPRMYVSVFEELDPPYVYTDSLGGLKRVDKYLIRKGSIRRTGKTRDIRTGFLSVPWYEVTYQTPIHAIPGIGKGDDEWRVNLVNEISHWDGVIKGKLLQGMVTGGITKKMLNAALGKITLTNIVLREDGITETYDYYGVVTLTLEDGVLSQWQEK